MNAEEPISVVPGPPEHWLVAMIDTRGFSEFAHAENDPGAVAGYVSRATKHILKTLGASSLLADHVIKPLGDGLLFMLNVEKKTQEDLTDSALMMLRALIAISSKFRTYLENDPPPGVFEVPSRLGIGLAYGPVVRLSIRSSKPKVEAEDYVGHTINLAARLQELARSGGCVAHKDVYEKIFKQDDDASSYFLRALDQSVDVRLRNIGSADETLVYSNAEIPLEYLKSKADETKAEEFAKQAMVALKMSYLEKGSKEGGRVQLPEATRFMLFKKEGKAYREIVEYMVGQRMTFKTEVLITIGDQGVCPIADAVLTGKPVLVSYTHRYDECDEDNLDNPYWQETLECFPKANKKALRSLAMHPASVLAIPLFDSKSSEVAAVAAFDSPEKAVFNQLISDEMTITLRVLYAQLFSPQESEPAKLIEL